MTNRVHMIWDNSNIFHSGQRVCGENEPMHEQEFRIYFKHLIDLAADNRPVEQVFCVGSVPPPTDAIWGHSRQITGREPETYERGAASGTEQAVDQALQVRMLRLGYDVNPPETLVLLTGDGAGWEEGVGFFADIKRLHEMGWKIEVLSWARSCKRVMREWAEANGVFVDLEPFYSSITFLQSNRRAKPLNLKARPR